MNRKLIVTLLHKNIEELNMITDSFMQMEEYPAAIIQIAKRKTEDIQLLLEELANAKPAISQPAEQVATPQAQVVQEEKTAPAPVIQQEIKEKVAEKLAEKPVQAVVEVKSKPEEPSHITTVKAEAPATVIEEKTETAEETAATPEKQEQTDKIKLIEDNKKTTLADKVSQNTVSRNDSLSKSDTNSLSSTLANKKITDIKTAISIGDRFRFQRELFRGNGEEMNKMLNYINQLASFEEVHSFLQSKYGWEESNVNASDFYLIVKRKFI